MRQPEGYGLPHPMRRLRVLHGGCLKRAEAAGWGGTHSIGNLVAQTARAKGAMRVMITDLIEYRLGLEKECGIDVCANTGKTIVGRGREPELGFNREGGAGRRHRVVHHRAGHQPDGGSGERSDFLHGSPRRAEIGRRSGKA